jgi:hypothetical protein
LGHFRYPWQAISPGPQTENLAAAYIHRYFFEKNMLPLREMQ